MPAYFYGERKVHIPKRKNRRRRHIWRRLLGVAIFVVLSTMMQVIVTWRYRIVYQVDDRMVEDVLRIETEPDERTDNNASMAYPLDVDLLSTIKQAIQKNRSIDLSVINPHPYRYLMLLPTCYLPEREISSKRILVLIKSYIGNFDQRNVIRKLWRSCTTDEAMTYVFLLGSSMNGSDDQQQQDLYKYSLLHNDTIQEDFLDVYSNNTLKTIMAFNWAATFCPQADLLLFHDDDYYVNYNKLATYLRNRTKTLNTNIYIGSLAVNAEPYRQNHSRWFLSYKQYPYAVFPPYVGGGAYVVSSDVARMFHLAFPYVKYLHIDDVYLGIVANKLSITPRYDSRLDSVREDALAKECSHDPEQLLIENCTLAITKRQLLYSNRNASEKLKTQTKKHIKNHHIYINFDKYFSYPLITNFKAIAEGNLNKTFLIRPNPINVHTFTYLNIPPKCHLNPRKRSSQRNILVLVKSYIKSYNQREVIRKQWQDFISDGHVTIVFLIGQGLHEKDQYLVSEEGGKHSDILQENFKEDYRNNTLKTIMGINWAVRSCSNADVLLFLDDDFYVMRKEMVNYLRDLRQRTRLYKGHLMRNSQPCRDVGQNLCLDHDEYPYDKFPDFINGGAYVMSYDVAEMFYRAIPYVKYLNRDDMYLGIVAWKLGITIMHDYHFVSDERKALAYECSHIPTRLLTNQCTLSCRSCLTSVYPQSNLLKGIGQIVSQFLKSINY